ncbi:MAG: FG-GAP-like repeat-containing protein, partial [Candidatus Omnitrophota bacterium]
MYTRRTFKTKYLISISLILTCIFFINLSAHSAEWKEVQRLLPSDGYTGQCFGNYVSISGNWAIVGGVQGKPRVKTFAYIFYFDGTKWTEFQKLSASNYEDHGNLSDRVAISGNCAIVLGRRYWNAWNNETYPNSIYFFNYNGTEWVEAQRIEEDEDDMRSFSGPISMSGDKALIGDLIFKYDGTEWIKEAEFMPSDSEDDDSFAEAVSLSKDVAIVGAPWDDGNEKNSGSAYIFRFNGTEWVEEQKLLASNEGESNYFGNSVSIAGNVAIAGSGPKNTVYVFEYNGSTWVEKQKLMPSDVAEHDYFGRHISISKDRMLIGALNDDDKGNASGSAYIFKYNGTEWAEDAKLVPSDGDEMDFFGGAVCISGNRAIIGAWNDDEKGEGSGSAYIFEVPSEFSTAPVIRSIKGNQSLKTALGTSDGKVYLYDHNGNTIPNWPQSAGNKPIFNRPAIADIDGDGLRDIVATTEDGIYVWNSDGTPASGWPYIEPTGAEGDTILSGPVIADIDRDNKLDIIVSVISRIPLEESIWIDRGVKVFNGDGTIKRFNGSKYFYSTTNKFLYIFIEAVGDLDGDGDLELLLSERWDLGYPYRVSSVSAFHHDGTQVKGWSRGYSGTNTRVKPCLGDLDNDGDLELVTVEYSDTYRIVSACHYDGGIVGGFSRIIPIKDTENPDYKCSSPVLGDLDNDGDLEIVLYALTDSTDPDHYISNVLAYHHDGTLVSGFPKEVKNWKNVYYPPTVADLDGDDNAEILVILHEADMPEPNKTGVIAYHNDGKVVDGFPKYISSDALELANNNENSLAVGDLNGDGDLEIILAGNSKKLHIIPIEGTFNSSKLEWPQYKYNSYNTNAYSLANELPYFSPIFYYEKVDETGFLKFYVEAYDEDNDYIDLGVIELPEGAGFRTKGLRIEDEPGYRNGKFYWRPKPGQAGEYSVVFTATDNIAPPVEMNVVISVTDKSKTGKLRVATHKPFYMDLWWSGSGGPVEFDNTDLKTSGKNSIMSVSKPYIGNTRQLFSAGPTIQVNDAALKINSKNTIMSKDNPNTWQPFPGVTIRVKEADRTLNTESRGYVDFTDLAAPATYNVIASMPGYESQSKTVGVEGYKSKTIVFYLKP